jgi:trehalose 6-phosphate phosphatase
LNAAMNIVKDGELTPAINEPKRLALFLDLDGTILDIAAAPMEVSTPPELIGTLRDLKELLGGAVAVLTGRKISDVDRLLAPVRLAAAGVHGTEIRLRPDDDIETSSDLVPDSLKKSVERLAGKTPGLLFEDKGFSIAVHYRAAPEMEPTLEKELSRLLDHHSSRLVLSHGRCVLELVPDRSTKGAALQEMMRLPPFRGRVPVMIGDDMPDETALAAAVGLGGLGLKVGGEHFREGPIDFREPAEVRDWLHGLAGRLQS